MSEGTLNSINLRERLFFYIVFAILIILMLLMIQPFFTVLVVSVISVIMLKPVYDYIFGLNWVKERKGLAASLTLIAVLVILVIPVVLIIWLTLNQLSGLLEQLAALDLDGIIRSIQQSVAEVALVGEVQPVETSATESVQPLLRAAAQVVTDLIVGLGSSLPSLIIQMVIFVVVVAALLPVYDTLIPRLEEISPLGPELSKLYTRKTTAMVKSIVSWWSIPRSKMAISQAAAW